MGFNYYPEFPGCDESVTHSGLDENDNERVTKGAPRVMRAGPQVVGAGPRFVGPGPRVMGAGPHADISLITIVSASGPGLQFLKQEEGKSDDDVDEFFDAPFISNALVINGGKTLAQLTGGKLKGD